MITDKAHEAACCAALDARVLIVGDAAHVVEEWTPTGEFSGGSLYLYTSGSTDSYKRICCTQQNLVFEARNFVEATGINADDTILCAIPLHHSYGLGNCLLDAAYTGATLVLEPDSVAPFAARHVKTLELLRAEQVRVFPVSPFSSMSSRLPLRMSAPLSVTSNGASRQATCCRNGHSNGF